MDENTFRILQSILRRDSTDTTYKYALLRALIEIADEYDHHIVSKANAKVVFPFGLVIEKWLYYYYPIIEQGLPQRNGADPNNPQAQHIAFRTELEELIEQYKGKGGYPAFVRDFRTGRLSGANRPLPNLLKKLKRTVADYPMKHLGFISTLLFFSRIVPCDFMLTCNVFFPLLSFSLPSFCFVSIP